jgi:peptide/nickel transport system substrate-binding protein
MILSIAYKSDAPWNDTAWKNETFDKLLIEARAELDAAKRKEMYGEMQRLIHDEGGAIIPMFADFLDAKRDEVKGFVPSPVFDFSGQRLGEKVWLDPV